MAVNSAHGITADAAVCGSAHLTFEDGIALASVVGAGNALPFAGAVAAAQGVVGTGA